VTGLGTTSGYVRSPTRSTTLPFGIGSGISLDEREGVEQGAGPAGREAGRATGFGLPTADHDRAAPADVGDSTSPIKPRTTAAKTLPIRETARRYAIDDARDSPHARWVRVVETGTGWGESDPDVCAEAFGP
jgi:hypothetical protein